ncbi:MAG TPA: Gfo/Idh/MocA family oxidoreductase [Mycobacteriales bacterium]|nr:Gfo/Idh/MocA family oxidoreductase [Mycobacteriales bacterium]
MDRLALVADLADPQLRAAVEGLADRLRAAGHRVLAWPADAELTLVFCDRPLGASLEAALADRAASGHPVLLAGPTVDGLSDSSVLLERAGLHLGGRTPAHEVRVTPGPAGTELCRRLPGELLVTEGLLVVDKTLDDVDVLLAAHLGLHATPILTLRATVGVCSIGTVAATVADPGFQLLVHRWVRQALGRDERAPIRVGMLGFGAIAAEHVRALRTVAGLELSVICDSNPARLDAARGHAAVCGSADELLDRPDVDLVVVSTPPDSHADWAIRALESGRHVVVEKPFSISVADADAVICAAERAGRAVTVYQNRRWDRDYLALKRVLRSGRIGAVFHYESFVGGYGHPCNYWHSDARVSGGAIYDWGSHYLDWMLDLFPGPIDFVTATEHKRHWLDVTNADHSRVGVRFADGLDAEFVHSHLAAAVKPKWYVLGTGGAVVGSWRAERVLGRDALGNLDEDPLTLAESPADLAVHEPDGSRATVALPTVAPAPFHTELAEWLLTGWPMSVTAPGSRRGVAVMAAATASARAGGRPVTPVE